MSDKLNNSSQQTDLLKAKLEDRNAEALGEIDAALSDAKMDIKIKEKGQAVLNQMRNHAQDEIKARTERVLAMRDAQKKEKNDLDTTMLEAKHKEMIDALLKRFHLSMEMGNKDIASLGKSYSLLQASSAVDYSEKTAENIPPDYLEITRKLKTGEALNQNENATLEGLIRKVATLEIKDPREAFGVSNEYAGLVILSELSDVQKMSVLRGVEDEKLFARLIVNLCASAYLSIGQCQELLSEASPKHPDQKQIYIDALSTVDSEGMRKFILDLQGVKAHALKTLDRNFQQNYAGKYLNPQTYLIGKAGQTLGVLTLVANFFANVNPMDAIKNQKQFLKDVAGLGTNPAFLMGLTVTGATVEYISGGFGKGWLSQALSKITEDKSITESERIKRRNEQMYTALNNYPEVTEFYYKNSGKIVQLKNDNKAVTIENMKAAGIKIPELKNTSGTVFENNIFQWANLLYDEEKGFALTGDSTQREFINEGRKAQGLKPFPDITEK